ncbi:MAG TPA: hypothetical protein VFS97_13305 [Nitrososphaeraceae archaeon]|nr:hypothetical protein [Nitrososphaeraceae archaeon]
MTRKQKQKIIDLRNQHKKMTSEIIAIAKIVGKSSHSIIIVLKEHTIQ